METVKTNDLTQEEIAERVKILRYKVFETQIEKVWREFEDAGFKPILIKGWTASQLYPEPFRRQFTDIDLLISLEKYDQAVKFSEDLKMNGLVDLHRGARHLDSVVFEELFSNSMINICGKTKIRVLRPEDHLRILCVHWLNDGGADREKLWDIYYAVANRQKNFDWDRLLNVVSYKRKKWIICAIGLAHKYLQLDIANTPVESEAKVLPRWLTKAVEKEWKSNVRLMPLHFLLNNKKELWKQIKKRVPPNPIQATVEMEGDLDKKPRILYQIKSIMPRLLPSFKRIRKTLRRRKGTDL